MKLEGYDSRQKASFGDWMPMSSKARDQALYRLDEYRSLSRAGLKERGRRKILVSGPPYDVEQSHCGFRSRISGAAIMHRFYGLGPIHR
jgi:hypothetical protein